MAPESVAVSDVAVIRSTPEGPGIGLRPFARRRAAGIDDHEQKPPQLDRFLRRQRTERRVGGKPRDGEAGEPVIVDQAAVEQLDVFDGAGAIALQLIGIGLDQRRSIGIAAHALDPAWQRYRAIAVKF